MALLWLVVVVLWTLLVLRVVGARATLSERTFATYLVLGALLAIAAAPPLASLVNPYNQPPSGFVLLVLTMGRLALVLAPVGYALRSRGTERALSVTDAFLLAFMVGFGFDLLGAVVTASAAAQPLRGLSFLPPWEIETDQRMTVAGFGYWAGLIALTYAAARRFLREPRIVVGVSLAAFLLVCLLATAQATALRPTGPLGWVLTLTLNGAATAWIALIAVVALSVGEAIWTARLAPGAPETAPTMLAEWQARLLALARGRPREYARVSAHYAGLRQAQLERAEATSAGRQAFRPSIARPPAPPQQPRAPSGLPTPPPPPTPARPAAPYPAAPVLGQGGPAPGQQVRPGYDGQPQAGPGGSGAPAPPPLPPLHDDERPTPRPAPPPISGGALDTLEPVGTPGRAGPERSCFWRHVGVAQLALALLLLLVVIVLPNLPVTIARMVWGFPLLSLELKQPPLTIVNIALVLLLLWWYVAAAGRPASDDPDDVVRFGGERAILHATLASVVLVLLDVRNTFLYPFYSVVATHTRASFPQLEPYQAQTLLLLLAGAAAGLTLNRAAAWRRAPLTERRASAIHHGVSVALILLLSWVVVALYLPTLTAFHDRFGTLLFALFGQSGNVVGGYVMIVFSAAVSWLTLLVLRPLAERIERFLVDDEAADFAAGGGDPGDVQGGERPGRPALATSAPVGVRAGSSAVAP